MNPCQHCQLRPAYQGKRGLCMPCYRRMDIRKRYPAQERHPAPLDGNCRHCGKYSVRLRPRRLCRACYIHPEINRQYPSDSKYAPKGDDYLVTLPILRVYPNLDARVPCPCERGWEGECPRCEAKQRRGLPVVESATETADEIIAFVRGLRRSCGGVMS